MFASRYFPRRYFAARYWPKVGADVVVTAIAMCGEVLIRAIHLGRPRAEAAHKGTTQATTAHKGRADLGCPAD
jgi:hypothetical protein